jgi:hypothetical protein
MEWEQHPRGSHSVKLYGRAKAAGALAPEFQVLAASELA